MLIENRRGDLKKKVEDFVKLLNVELADVSLDWITVFSPVIKREEITISCLFWSTDKNMGGSISGVYENGQMLLYDTISEDDAHLRLYSSPRHIKLNPKIEEVVGIFLQCFLDIWDEARKKQMI